MIFADTSFWAGLINDRDGHHAMAQELWRRHGTDGIVTTNQVRGETWTLLRRRAGHDVACAFLDALAIERHAAVVMIDPDQERAALAWLRRHDERSYSFVDATSFVLMEQLGLTEALAFDGDFSAAGFVELRN